MQGGWGRMSGDVIYQRARADIDALSNFLGSKPFFMGEQPRSIDASVTSILRHVIDAPFVFDTKDHAKTKANLVDYLARMKQRFAI
jgi:glutathione S-transferase